MLRNNSYDFLPALCQTLKGKYLSRKETFEGVIVKADASLPYSEFKEQLDTVSAELDLLDNDINVLCKGVYQRFTTLKQDFQTGKINQSTYMGYLKHLKDLLVDTETKLTNSNLHSEEIATELKKYFSPE